MAKIRKAKRQFGDRRDGRYVRVSGLNTIMAYLFPKRCDCEVYLHDTLDATELVKYLKEKNDSHPNYKSTVFHAFILACARLVKERPLMNRFVQGYRTYERDEISIAFVAKRRFKDGADEALITLVPKDDDTLDTVSHQLYGDLTEMRKSEHSTGGIDKTLDTFAKIPRLLLAVIIRFIRILDFWGKTPKALTEGDTNYATILASNLGSIGGPAVYHHLNNYGTNSIMITLGSLHEEPRLMEDGSIEKRWIVDFGATLDERIADGFYFCRSLGLLKYIFAHPELLDRPLSEPSGYEYK